MHTILSIEGSRFKINGSLTYSEYPACPDKYRGCLFNMRMIQGIFDDYADPGRFNRFGRLFDADKNTDDLVRALPLWYEKGIRAITVGFQGGGACFTIDSKTIDNNAFSEDGTSMDPRYLSRMDRLIRACDALGMAVIVSYFYCGQSYRLRDDAAVTEAVRTASRWLKAQGYTNVIIEIANEHDVQTYDVHPILYHEEGIAKLIGIAREESGGMPVGCSTTGAYFSNVIARASDVILIHGNNMTRQVFYNHIQEAKAVTPARPIVANEDSQGLTQFQVALDQGISWGYYNNTTKQEPPADWGITEGEDTFFARRLALSLGIEDINGKPLEQHSGGTDLPEEVLLTHRPTDDDFYLQGLEADTEWNGKRWIRLASLCPEKIQRVDFYRNGILYASAYNDPFTINYLYNWIQKPVEGVVPGEHWKARVLLTDGSVIAKETES